MRVAYVTFTNDHDDPDLDRAPVVAALKSLGADAHECIWDDPLVDWSSYDKVIVRSTWDYVEKFQAFRQWLINVDNVSTLFNSRMVIEPNLVKTYLRDLEVAGISIVPTQWIASVEELTLTGDIVIKPVISAGAADTIRTSNNDVARTQVEKILDSGRLAMAQPYLPEVDDLGEISIVCLHGEPRWAVRKIPALSQGGHGGGRDSVPLTDDLEAFALKTLAAFPGATGTLYARVDLVPTADGILLMELELAEPSLFIPLGPPDAADQFARAILA